MCRIFITDGRWPVLRSSKQFMGPPYRFDSVYYGTQIIHDIVKPLKLSYSLYAGVVRAIKKK